MTKSPDIKSTERKRQKRERLIILITFIIIIGLSFLETKVLHLSPPSGSFSGNILLFVLININLILVLLLLFLVLRNVVKLIFERRRNILGAKLRTRLVVAFVLFALVPTTFLFFVSLQFINTSIDYWFNVRVEKSLHNSLEVGQTFYKQAEHDVTIHASKIGEEIARAGLISDTAHADLAGYLQARHEESRLDTLEIVLPSHEELVGYRNPDIGMPEPIPIPSQILRRCLSGERGIVDTHVSNLGDLVRGFTPIISKNGEGVAGVLAVGIFIPAGLTEKMKNISDGVEDYKQLKLLKQPIKISLIIILLIISLIIVFSATWFGFYLARGITIPIQHLAEGTRRVAGGDLDFSIEVQSEDEVGTLVESFNKMTGDLRTSRSELQKAHRELRGSNLELDQRRRYMEIILKNVAAGVISIDNDGRIATMNRFAESLLGVRFAEVAGKTYQELATAEQLRVMNALLEEAQRARKGSIQKAVHLTVNQKSLSLLVNATILRDDAGNHIGMVMVFGDLTQMEKAQRMAAWREVARRIAHEVKNPLTPIQLSAQRLRKRYIEKLAGDNKVLDDCTRTIINQVEELKRLVNEFSLFARLPATNPTLNNLENTIEEVAALYRDGQKDIDLIKRVHQTIPEFYFDREQIKRVMINLFDNAIASMDGNGKIEVDLFYDHSIPPMVRIEVGDTGKGVPLEDKSRLFEPYFSTKKGGTGLGLAIVSTIISDHNGYIRVQDNEPKGTKFVIELPCRV